MKKICKSNEPQSLTEYRQDNPHANWEEVRNSGPYAEIRAQIFQDQGHLCAFCETGLPVSSPHNQRIEHFHPKSDTSDPDHNWALDWDNMIGVCKGGSNQNSYPTPENLSCDAYKDHLIEKGKLSKACEGYVLNPLRIINTPCLFHLNKRTGDLLVDEDACTQLADFDNRYQSLSELVQKTIEILNLNCQRLRDDRLTLLHEYERLKKRARRQNQHSKRYKALQAERWFRTRWKPYFTTRRILLGQAAEEWLTEHEYQG